jgi:hypothetical protein
MHGVAVVGLCVLVAFYAWRDGVELFVAWYSGAEPPLSTGTKVWTGARIVLCLAAGATAAGTL